MGRSERPPVVVIGVGNAMRRDDGIGPAVLESLGRTDLGDVARTDVELVMLDGESTRLIEAWRGRRRAIVIDAVRSGEPPGRIHRVELGRDPLPDGRPANSSHSSGVAEAIALGRALGRLPDELIVIGVEAGDLSLGEGLSSQVSAALPTLVQNVRAEARR